MGISSEEEPVSLSSSVIFFWKLWHHCLSFISELNSQFVSYFANMKSYNPTLKIFFSPFDVDCEEVPLKLQMEFVDFSV